MDFLSIIQTIDTNLLVLILIILVVALMVFQLRRPSNVSTPLQNLTQTLQDVRVETAKLSERFQSKAEIENQMAQSIKRLETIMAGSATVGDAAENLIEEFLTLLPPEWQTRNFQVGNKTVEFGLRLPNGLVLPIDSKWVGANQLDQLNGTENPDERKKLKDQIEKQVVNKAKEVQKYINPEITTPYGIAVVPDAVYNLCPSVNITTLKFNVTVISYSLLLPYLILTFQTALATLHNIDVARIGIHLRAVEQTLQELSTELEGRYSKGLTMLSNSRETMQKHLGKANSALVSISAIAESQEIEAGSNEK
jgi:DNA recombination protein RmuC